LRISRPLLLPTAATPDETPWKALITCARHWKLLTVLPTFWHHWKIGVRSRLSSEARRFEDARSMRLELPIWMKF
jgi:hypothetical protein